MSSVFLGYKTFGLMSGDGAATTRESDNNRGGSAKTSTPKEVIEPYFLSSLRNDCTLRDPGMTRRCLHKVLMCLHFGSQCNGKRSSNYST